MNLEKYFKELRFSKSHHLRLGDIRLTKEQQDEIVKKVEQHAEEEKIVIRKQIIQIRDSAQEKDIAFVCNWILSLINSPLATEEE